MDQLRTDDPKSADFTLSDDPFGLFASWMKDAEAAEPEDPNAMALATAGSDGLPDVRMVLLKGFDARGFVFYTNTQSTKGEELPRTRKPPWCCTGRACVGRCGPEARSRR